MRPPLIPTLAAAAVVALTVSLGQWQLRRADEKAAAQAGRDAALAAAPVSLAGAPADAASLDGRRVLAEGTFDDARTVFLDNRTRNGVAGFHVLAPLRLAGDGRHVLVLRGWVARDLAQRERLPALGVPAGPVRVEGLAMAELAQPIVLAPEPAAPTSRLWQRFDPERYRRWSGLELLPVIVRQTSELPDGLERDWVQPGSGVDKHLGYAFQWFALAAATAGLWLWFAVLGRGRRKS